MELVFSLYSAAYCIFDRTNRLIIRTDGDAIFTRTLANTVVSLEEAQPLARVINRARRAHGRIANLSTPISNQHLLLPCFLASLRRALSSRFVSTLPTYYTYRQRTGETIHMAFSFLRLSLSLCLRVEPRERVFHRKSQRYSRRILRYRGKV